jgi:hypothetical protein
MQIIKSNLLTILLPDKGYKLVNKTNGQYYKKIYLGINDSIDNYGEEIDEKYMNVDFIVEVDDIKKTLNDINDQNNTTIDLLLLTIDELYVSIEPVLASIPKTMSDITDEKLSRFIKFYVLMIQRGLKKIDEIPTRFRNDVADYL